MAPTYIPPTFHRSAGYAGVLGGTSYFENGPTRGAYYQTGGRFFDVRTDLGVFYFTSSADWSFNVGMGGPAWNHIGEVDGYYWEYPGWAKIALHPRWSYTSSGCYFGCSVILVMQVKLEYVSGLRWVSDGWNSRLERDWSTAFEIGPLRLEIDLLKVLETLIRLVMTYHTGGSYCLPTANGGIFGNFILGDQNASPVPPTYRPSKLGLNPVVALPIDLIQFVPGLQVLQAGMRKAQGNLSAGPYIGVSMPIALAIDWMAVDNDWGKPYYENWASNNGYDYFRDYWGASMPRTFQFLYVWNYAFDIWIGLYFAVKIAQVYSFEKTVGFGVLQVLGRGAVGWNHWVYSHGQTSVVGQLSDLDGSPEEMPEIVFA